MEPLSTATIAVAVGSVILTKALERTGENLGDALSNEINSNIKDKIHKFLIALKKHSPETVTAIEKAPEKTLDYSGAILEVELAAKTSPEINQAVAELVAVAKTVPHPQFKDIIDNPTPQKLAEKIGMYVSSYGTGYVGTINL